MSTPEWTIELPEAWQTAPFRPGFIKVIGEPQLPRGRSALMVLAMLKDSTNVLALTWDRGMRLARVSPETDWALEERFTGRPPGPGEGVLIDLWRMGIEVMASSRKAVEAEMAAPGWEPSPAVFVLNHPDALDSAYEAYCESDAAPVSREMFELGVELIARGELEDGRADQ